MKIEILIGDITKLKVDAIVNAANERLQRGGGVDGAIHNAAGPKLQDECRTIGGCKVGDAVMTLGYLLPARHVIHTVGPVWHGGTQGEPDLLRSCYRKCMEVARKNGFLSLAFPAISTGVFGYPMHSAAKIAISEVRASEPGSIEMVVFACFDTTAAETYREVERSARSQLQDD